MGGTFNCHLNPLFILQKRAIRMVCQTEFLAHSDPLFFSCRILKLNDLYRYNLAIFMYQNKDNSSFQRSHFHNTRFRNDLLPPRERLTITQHSTIFQSISYYNSLPTQLKSLESLSSFKFRLKQHILTSYL